MLSTIYGFIIDTVFFNKTAIDLDGKVDQGIGFLTDKQINHFVKTSRIHDIRNTRLTILGQPLIGKNAILFDKTKLLDISLVEGITDIQLTQLFNIIETAYISQNKTEAQLNTIYTNSISEFGIYTPDTISLSSSRTAISIIIDTPTEIKVPDWIEFQTSINGHDVKFHLWLKSESFIKEYPLSTISKVVPPCDPIALLNPSSFSNVLDTLVKSNTFSFGVIEDEMKIEDHTGTLTYYTKYVQNSTTSYQMPFGIMYKGAKPSTLEIRKAIREYLISKSLAPEENWKIIFPDLFVDAQFFLIPVYDNITIRPDVPLYPSIINYKKMLIEAKRIFPNMSDTIFENRMEIIMNGFKEFFTCVIPDPLNATNDGLLQRHPTYMYHHRNDPGFAYMELKTQEFNDHFNSVLSILFGEATNNFYTENYFDDRMYLSFVIDGVEFHILSIEGFKQ